LRQPAATMIWPSLSDAEGGVGAWDRDPGSGLAGVGAGVRRSRGSRPRVQLGSGRRRRGCGRCGRRPRSSWRRRARRIAAPTARTRVTGLDRTASGAEHQHEQRARVRVRVQADSWTWLMRLMGKPPWLSSAGLVAEQPCARIERAGARRRLGDVRFLGLQTVAQEADVSVIAERGVSALGECSGREPRFGRLTSPPARGHYPASADQDDCHTAGTDPDIAEVGDPTT
jgi:hypothetical protein